jgi:hypothetical protein
MLLLGNNANSKIRAALYVLKYKAYSELARQQANENIVS